MPARAARGARFFFVDADTAINPDLISAALRAMDAGAAGGGAWTRLEGDVPWYARLIWLSFIVAGHFVGFTGGAFMFCTRAAFPASGGFDERMFGGEEFGMAQTLKRHGPFVVLWQRALTSGRRFRKNSGLELLAMARALFWPARALGRRSSVEKIWYDSNRAEDAATNGSWRRRLSNALTLVIIVMLLMPPVWALIAALWPAAMHSFPGTIRRTCGIFTVHAGLILWVFATMLVRALVSQPRWPERVRFALLAAFCLWQAGRSTQAVVQLWLQALAWMNG